MIKQIWRYVTGWLVVAGLLMGLTGCNNLKGDIPQAVLSEAVAIQAQQEQAALWQQLAPKEEDAPTLAVKHVKLKQVRRVKVADELAYEVAGTYQYKLRYSNRPTVKQTKVPFDLILQGDREANNWRVLQQGQAVSDDRAWRWQPLDSDRA